MRKQPQVTEQTRANLTHAFWGLYLVKPIDKITVREITDRAGYNRATFYLYYHDVYDLLEQLEEGILTQINLFVSERLLAEDMLDISQHAGAIVRLAQRFREMLPRLLAADPSFGERLKEIIAPLLDRFIIPHEGLSAQEQDVLREFYLSGMLSAISAWVDRMQEMPIERFVELVVSAVVFGASGPVGEGAPVVPARDGGC